MTSIITGDIINSRSTRNQKVWMAPLKKVLSAYGETPKSWEIFRGDNFQLEVKKPEDAFLAAIRIKACIKSIKEIDVRMAIGIGKKTYHAAKITESNGEAFINSGELYENLKKIKQNLAVKSPWPEMDAELNLMISLASIAMDKWTTSSAELVALSLQHKDLSQAELGKKLDRSQSAISERQTRAHYTEITELEKFISRKIKQQRV